MSPNSGETGWMVVWTESRAEKKVASRIAAKGIEPWLPTITQRHRWSDRWREVVLPLFPGYLFARAGEAHVHHLLRTPGVLTVVKAGTKPAVVPASFIASLRRALELDGTAPEAVVEPPTFAVDDEVVVQNGPLAGLRGVVRQAKGSRQLVVWIASVGRGVAFTISAALVAHAETRSSQAV